jgi:hypothetical protein
MPDYQNSKGNGARRRGGSRQHQQHQEQKPSQPKPYPLPILIVILNGIVESVQWETYPAQVACSMANSIMLPTTEKEVQVLLSSLGLTYLQSLVYTERCCATKFLGSGGLVKPSEKKALQDFYGFADGKITNLQQLQHAILLVKFLVAFYKANPNYTNSNRENDTWILKYIIDIEVILSIVQKSDPSSYKELSKTRELCHCYPPS